MAAVLEFFLLQAREFLERQRGEVQDRDSGIRWSQSGVIDPPNSNLDLEDIPKPLWPQFTRL